MTGIYQNDDAKKQHMLFVTSAILDAMKYKRKLLIRLNKFEKENEDAVDSKKSTSASEELD